jgi:formamidopyrimidine-DNA glycosylase
MPEGLEVEIWSKAAQVLIGRTITEVWVDPRCGGDGAHLLNGARINAVTRRAKTLLMHSGQIVFGVHFGMTGRLVIDGHSAIGELEYSSSRDLPEWDRCRIKLRDGGELRVNDPRRWSRYQVSTEPDPSGGIFGPYGPDAMAISAPQLAAAIAGRERSVKSLLLDQRSVAGLGNMCVDEVLWRACINPHRRVSQLTSDEVQHLATIMAATLSEMLAAGGSNMGQLFAGLRRAGALCPQDASQLSVHKIAGRTTVWCSQHQR